MAYYQLTFQPAVRRTPQPLTMYRVQPEDGAAPRRAVEVLREGGLLVFPTDEGYVVGCAATHREAVARLCALTGADPSTLWRFAASEDQEAAAGGPVRPVRHPVPLALMQAAGVPLAAAPPRPRTPPPRSAQHVVFILGDTVDLVLDAGPVAPAGAPVAARGSGTPARGPDARPRTAAGERADRPGSPAAHGGR